MKGLKYNCIQTKIPLGAKNLKMESNDISVFSYGILVTIRLGKGQFGLWVNIKHIKKEK